MDNDKGAFMSFMGNIGLSLRTRADRDKTRIMGVRDHRIRGKMRNLTRRGSRSQQNQEFLSTGQAAKLLGVTPDTVLKWVKTGRLPATRTPGGHYRLARADIDRQLESDKKETSSGGESNPGSSAQSVLHCWEFYAQGGKVLSDCMDCLVFRARALRCYEMSNLPPETGYAGTFCKTSCTECPYYQEQVRRKAKVLVVTDSVRLREVVEADIGSSRLELEFASCEYDASTVVDWFKPEYVVLDCSRDQDRCGELCANLCSDPRIPEVRIILASPSGDWTGPRSKNKVIGEIPNLTSLMQMEECISSYYDSFVSEEKKETA